MYTDNWRKFFLPESIREQQGRALAWASEMLDAGKNPIAEIGTGVGKSYIAHCMASTSRRGFIVTSDNHLVSQYENTFLGRDPEFASIIGKANYTCPHFGNCQEGSGSSGEDEMDGDADWDEDLCPDAQTEEGEPPQCAYKCAKERAQESKVAFTNVHYYSIGVKFDPKWEMRKITVFDEAHSIEECLRGQTETSFSSRALEFMRKMQVLDEASAVVYNLKSERGWQAPHSWRKSHGRPVDIDGVRRFAYQAVAGANEIIRLYSEGESKTQRKQVKRLTSIRDKLSFFLNNSDKSPWVADVFEYSHNEEEDYRKYGGIRLLLRPVYISSFTKSLIFSQAEQFMFQSATIIDGEQFARDLGIRNWAGQRFRSPFLAENRRVFALNSGSLNQKNKDEGLPKCIDDLIRILDTRFFQKGIVHTNSYDIQDKIKAALKPNDRYIFVERGKGSAEEAVARHKNSVLPTVLFSPRMTQGVDLDGDHARFCVVFKMPFAYLGDRIVKQRTQDDRNWYSYTTAKKLIQSIGRGVRSQDDWCDTFILDADFDKFARGYPKIGKYFGDALITNRDDCVAAVHERRE